MRFGSTCAALTLAAVALAGCPGASCSSTATWLEPDLVPSLRQNETTTLAEWEADRDANATWLLFEPVPLATVMPLRLGFSEQAVVTQARHEDHDLHLRIQLGDGHVSVEGIEEEMAVNWPVKVGWPSATQVVAQVNDTLRPIHRGDAEAFSTAIAKLQDQWPGNGRIVLDLAGPWDLGCDKTTSVWSGFVKQSSHRKSPMTARM